MLFLIQYDRARGAIVQMKEFDGASRKAAEDARLELELSLNGRGIQDEVVILDAPNKEALRRTHSRYFESLAELVRAQTDGGRK
jgi:hypothetical protein